MRSIRGAHRRTFRANRGLLLCLLSFFRVLLVSATSTTTTTTTTGVYRAVPHGLLSFAVILFPQITSRCLCL
ncbi:hypothetical protein B0T09DRAFT_329898, partial [Sordaria sp. MPI-SDFR-AT-0083]